MSSECQDGSGPGSKRAPFAALTMTEDASRSQLPRRGANVAVIASDADLRCALRLRRQPDFFELRLDAFRRTSGKLLETGPRLRAPLIVTARHPAEGGLHNLRPAERRSLLTQFLPMAAYVDIELRSLPYMQPVLDDARKHGVGNIISVHDFRRTPAHGRLKRLAFAARDHGADIFKIATRADDPRGALRLIDFFFETKEMMPISAMAMGRDARELRLFLAREGSSLNYTHLKAAQAPGQWSLTAFRRALAPPR